MFFAVVVGYPKAPEDAEKEQQNTQNGQPKARLQNITILIPVIDERPKLPIPIEAQQVVTARGRNPLQQHHARNKRCEDAQVDHGEEVARAARGAVEDECEEGPDACEDGDDEED